MTHTLRRLMAEKPVLLADGATGTNFFEMGLESGDAPELWNVDAPEKVTALHDGFVDAGADIILTNTFGANANRLALHHAENRVHELNAAAAKIAKASAARANRTVLVAGSVGPTGDLFEPMGKLTHADAVAAFTEQMKGLKEGGADVLWIETMSSEEEIMAASEAAQGVEMDYVFTASFDTAGRTMMGVTPARLPKMATEMSAHSHHGPCAVGANCGVGASDLLASILDMTKDGEVPVAIIAKANCGVPQVKGDAVVYTGTVELMADYARLAIDAGAKIIGGCCGTTASHLAAMREAIDNHTQASRPAVDVIVEKTGPFVNALPTETPEPREPAQGRRRGRRR
ncbi:MAG: betaine--homocysteine S-methyltransferase [Pseudomonadota bacterium]